MYKIRFTNSEGETVITTIACKKDLNKIIKIDAIDSIIETKIGNRMPISLHNYICEHNSKLKLINKH